MTLTTDWLYPLSVASDGLGLVVGGVPWSDAGNAAGDTPAAASIVLEPFLAVEGLYASDFRTPPDFTLSVEAVIGAWSVVGVEFGVEARRTGGAGPVYSRVQPMSGPGALEGADQAVGQALPALFGWRDFGAPDSLLGLAESLGAEAAAALVRTPGFGVGLLVENTDPLNTRGAEVSQVRMRLTLAPPPSQGPRGRAWGLRTRCFGVR